MSENAFYSTTFPLIDVWFIEARTGCTCCASENFVKGPYRNEAEANENAQFMHDTKRLASQYAANGKYSVVKEQGELLPDDRIICGGMVYIGIEERSA